MMNASNASAPHTRAAAGALVIAFGSAAALADFADIRLDFSGQTQTSARSGPNTANDERTFNDRFRYITDDGLFGEPVFTARSIDSLSAVTQTRGEAQGFIEAGLDATLARFELDADFSSSVFGNGLADASLNFNGSMRVETTQTQLVEFTLILELGEIAGNQRDIDASIDLFLGGTSGQQRIELEQDDAQTERRLVIEQELQAGQDAFFQFQANIGTEADQDNAGIISDFRLLVEARVIPAPAGLAPAALLGALAARRRR